MPEITDDKLAATSAHETTQQILGRPYGGKGIRAVVNTTPVTGLNGYWITVLEDTVISAITAVPGFTITGLTGLTLPAGTQLGVRFIAITLTSGKILINEL